ncbi:MAG: putative transposase [Arenicella sp.]|jgi:putative transposase
MSQKRSYKQYPKEFKTEAVALVLDQGYSVPDAAKSLGSAANMLSRWKGLHEQQITGKSLVEDEREELKRLSKENKELRMEKEILKRPVPSSREKWSKVLLYNDRSYELSHSYFCRVMKVVQSAFYAWQARLSKLVTAQELELYSQPKVLFKASRDSLGSRELSKKLNETGFNISRYLTRKLMIKLKLKVAQRLAYKVTTKHKHSDKVADNLLNQNFNPLAPNDAWDGDITYRKTAQGWMYLAIVMDLYSRRIVGWHIEKRMTTDLISKAIIKAVNLRQPKQGLVFHSDRGYQHTSKHFGKLLKGNGILAFMGDVGACWDNAVVERFFGSLKHDWILKVAQPTREHMKQDVTTYMKYYNQDRLHTTNGDMSPIKYEMSLKKVSGWS